MNVIYFAQLLFTTSQVVDTTTSAQDMYTIPQKCTMTTPRLAITKNYLNFPSKPPTYSAIPNIFSSSNRLPTICTLTCAPS